MTTNAVTYWRVAEDRENERAGVDRQLELCRQLADERGWHVVDEFIDNDISVYSRKPRLRGLQELIEP